MNSWLDFSDVLIKGLTKEMQASARRSILKDQLNTAVHAIFGQFDIDFPL
jgi:hypothetical protein